jgi:menaquinone-dependent protoporphyrinogen IX oxidase
LKEEIRVTADTKPKVLFVYYTLSDQTRRVVEAMANALTERGCDVTKAALEFTDPKWTRFSTGSVPMSYPAMRIPAILFAQRTRKTGEIRIPPEAQEGDYDLVVLGSPTWWLTTNMPIRSYLKSPAAKTILDGKPFAAVSVSRRYWKGNIKDIRKLGEGNGGRWIDETHFLAAGGQVKSMLSWLSYMKHGEARERAFGLKMPPPNLRPDFEGQASAFVNGMADRVLGEPVASQPAKTTS